MGEDLEPLILDFLEWLAREPRTHGDVMDVWRTSCPRLTVWEDSLERGLVQRGTGLASVVTVTPAGKALLAGRRRLADVG